MVNLISNAIAQAISFFKEHKLDRLFAGVGAVVLLFVTNADLGENSKPIGERIAEQQHETSVNSERPKTTGDILDEARGDVPFDQRMKNITRDSKEAFQQFGEGIGNSAKETLRELKDNVTPGQ